MRDLSDWYEPGPEPPYFCCHTPTWSRHEGKLYCESCDADIPTPSGPPLDAHVRVFRGEPLLPGPVTVEAPPRPPGPAEECPGCDEPGSESGWDDDRDFASSDAELSAFDHE